MLRFSTLVLFFFSVFQPYSEASHAVGGEIMYEHLDSNAYRITLVFYRSCSGVAAPATVAINVSNTCSYANMVVFLDMDTVEEITPLCYSATSDCAGGSVRGFERYTYHGIMNIPGPCNQWTFSHAESSRSSEITTINPNQNLYIYADLNNQQTEHSSPIFLPVSIPQTCIDQPYRHTNLAKVAPNDLLVYHLIDPLKGPATPINYRNDYSATQPISGSVSFDTTTGTIGVVSTEAQIGLYAVEVCHYRNGILLGRIIRDMELMVIPCTNALPEISGFNGTDNYTVKACVGQNNCWSIQTSDADLDSTSISLPSGIPFSATHIGLNDQVDICWMPQHADTALSPFRFVAGVTDNNCPRIGYQSEVYTIIVIDSSDNYCRLLLTDKTPPLSELFNVYPNPASTEVVVKALFPDHTLKVTNHTGNTLLTKNIVQTTFTLPISFPDGIYQFSVISPQGKMIVSRKIVVVN